MDWFFGFSGNSVGWFQDMIKVAVISAKTNTSLKLNCLYDGPDCELLSWLSQQGVNIHRVCVPFKDELFSKEVLKANEGSSYNPDNASGHFLRVLVHGFSNSKCILYTDCDVMFLQDIASIDIEPDNVSVVNEYTLNRGVVGNNFNSGVMIFNREKLKSSFNDICSYFKENNYYKSEYSSYDQVLLNEFYRNKEVKYLPLEYNWRPFQGFNSRAKIVHFHGPKPHRVKSILSGNIVKGEEGLLPYIEANREGYEKYMELYEEYLEKVKT